MKIIVKQDQYDDTKAKLYLVDKDSKITFQADAYVGQNGMTKGEQEGDRKTPIGVFNLGLVFGMHKNINCNLEYMNINENLYWVDDVNSAYYNQLVDITNVRQDWITSEHLIEYPIQYEYALEIKTNPNNAKGRGSAIFLHCSNNRPTAGCIAIERDKMRELLSVIDEDTIIEIKSNNI